MGGRLFLHQLCNCDNNNSMTHSCSEDNCVTFHPNTIFVFRVKSVMFYHPSIIHPSTENIGIMTGGGPEVTHATASYPVLWTEDDEIGWSLKKWKKFQKDDRKKLGGSFHTSGGQHSPLLNFICVLTLLEVEQPMLWSSTGMVLPGWGAVSFSHNPAAMWEAHRAKTRSCAVFTFSCHPTEDKQMECITGKNEL